MGEMIIYQDDSGTTNLEVKLENETLWLSQKQLSDLFDVTTATINEHIKNIYYEKELEKDSTIRKFLIVQQEGTRNVKRDIEHYNLDMIISVGYRVKSNIATRFRQWATARIKEYIIKGKTKVNQTHYEVGKKVRETIKELGGTMPEDLPTPKDSVSKIEKSHKSLEEKKQ